MKKKNQELEKFKFVLDYKIKELKRQIEPREQDIQGMTKQIKEMDTELQHYNSSNNNLDLAISDLRLKLKASDMEIKKEREMVHKCAAVVRKFKIDLNECIKHIQDPATLKKQLKTVYQKYCLQTESANATHKSAAEAQLAAISGPAVLDELEMDVQAELARQRNYMEEKVSSLRQKIAKDQLHHRQDSIRVMNENVTLIKYVIAIYSFLGNTIVTNIKKQSFIFYFLGKSINFAGTSRPPKPRNWLTDSHRVLKKHLIQLLSLPLYSQPILMLNNCN